jgi:hypothetical protein
MKGFKGFSKDWKCRNKQYEVGKTFEEPEAKLCEKGLHFCEYPLDVFGYYSPGNMNRFAEVDADEIAEERQDDKLVCKKLTIKAELSLKGMIDAAVSFVFDRANWTEKKTSAEDNEGVVTGDKSGAASATGYRGAASATGYRGAASATGYSGAASATGDSGAASATGYKGAASATGKNGFASALGVDGRTKAALGNWITLAEWEQESNSDWRVKEVRSAKIDGEILMPDTWYWLKDGKIVTCEEME